MTNPPEDSPGAPARRRRTTAGSRRGPAPVVRRTGTHHPALAGPLENLGGADSPDLTPDCRGPRARRCCTNRHRPARCQPTGSLPADAIRRWSAEGDHPIQNGAAEMWTTSGGNPTEISALIRRSGCRTWAPAVRRVPATGATRGDVRGFWGRGGGFDRGGGIAGPWTGGGPDVGRGGYPETDANRGIMAR